MLVFFGQRATVKQVSDGPARRAGCVTPIVLYTQLDAQCDELAQIVGRTSSVTIRPSHVLPVSFNIPINQSVNQEFSDWYK